MAKKTPHLEDLFNKGKSVTIEDSEGVEYEIFVRRPGPNQQQIALDAANAKLATYTIQYDKREGPRYDSIALMVRAQEDKDELIDEILEYNSGDIRQQAYHEVLYGDEGSQWDGDDDSRSYIDILNGVSLRIEEIEKYNADIDEDDQILREEDAELIELLGSQEEFQAEVATRETELALPAREKHVNKPIAQLQNELIKIGIETEGKLYWYEEYQTKLLYYACRKPDAVRELYFSEPYAVMELPNYIRGELYAAYEELEMGSEELKNSLSLPSS